MKTHDLISMLATGLEPIDRSAALRRYGAGLAGGVAVSVALMHAMLGLLPDLSAAAAKPMFWVKIVFVASLTAAAVPMTLRVATPGRTLGRWPAALLAPVIAMWLLAAIALATAAPGERAALVAGTTWAACPWNIAALSAPVFAGVLWGLKGLAPTRLRLAGASAGLVAGAAGASTYVLHCPELAAPFLGVWYVLGMLIPAAVGAAIGPRILRW